MIQLDSVSFLISTIFGVQKVEIHSKPCLELTIYQKVSHVPKMSIFEGLFLAVAPLWDKMAKNEEENDAKSLGFTGRSNGVSRFCGFNWLGAWRFSSPKKTLKNDVF